MASAKAQPTKECQFCISRVPLKATKCSKLYCRA